MHEALGAEKGLVEEIRSKILDMKGGWGGDARPLGLLERIIRRDHIRLRCVSTQGRGIDASL